MKRFFIDRIHRLPRVWSNQELRKFAHLFSGSVVNVSAWKDEDKEGGKYQDYFTQAASYQITNYNADANGYQGVDGEVYLDLEQPLPKDLQSKFDTVFNHTTLEHVYEVREAFKNLCAMSRDIVIVVLPFLQQYHAHYGDYWRFSPEVTKKLFAENGLELIYQSFNNHPGASVYLFAVASKQPDLWRDKFPDWEFTCLDPRPVLQEPYAGCHALPNRRFRLLLGVKSFIKRLISRFR